MQGRVLLVWVLLNVVCVWQLDAHEDRDEDVDDALFEQAQIRPLRMLKERRGLDWCQTNANPCENSGRCCSEGWCTEGGADYSCLCTEPFSGKHCEKKCPLKECWRSFYKTVYRNGKKQPLDTGICKQHVETLHSCLTSSMTSPDVCYCDDKSLIEAINFDKERKEFILEKQCSGGTGGCQNKKVEGCIRKIRSVEGAIDSSHMRNEAQKCSLVDEAISCMNALAGSDFNGCSWNRKLFTENAALRHAQWRTWCMGKFCSLYDCGPVKIPTGCSADSVRGRTAPVFRCMKDKIEACVPSQAGRLGPELEKIQRELDVDVADKCRLHKQVRTQCQRKEDTRSLQARDLLRALLQQTLTD